jgi:hypothetical protein
MGIVASLLVIAVGAIMRFAVTVAGHGFNIHTAGVILIIVGIIGAILSIGYWASWGGFGGSGFGGTGVGRRTTVVRSESPVGTTVVRSEPPVVSTERTVVRQHEVR